MTNDELLTIFADNYRIVTWLQKDSELLNRITTFVNAAYDLEQFRMHTSLDVEWIRFMIRRATGHALGKPMEI